jgi:hypothetical protein
MNRVAQYLDKPAQRWTMAELRKLWKLGESDTRLLPLGLDTAAALDGMLSTCTVFDPGGQVITGTDVPDAVIDHMLASGDDFGDVGDVATVETDSGTYTYTITN